MLTIFKSVAAHRLSRAVCTCLAAGFVLLGSAGTALADHGHGRVIARGRIVVGNSCGPVVAHRHSPRVLIHRHGDDCGCDSCFAKREYQRGVNRGEAAGTNAGYRDGFNAQAFCDAPIDELCDNSRAYRDGYLAAFKNAYRHAFERGRFDRARAYRPHRGC